MEEERVSYYKWVLRKKKGGGEGSREWEDSECSYTGLKL